MQMQTSAAWYHGNGEPGQAVPFSEQFPKQLEKPPESGGKMPNCFQLTKIGEEEASPLQDIDTDLWNHFTDDGEPDGNTKYFMDWHGTIGLSLAMGQDWDEIRSYCLTDRARAVVDYLKENYTSSAFYSPK